MISTIGIVSLSSGIIGEDFVNHAVELGVKRLKALGLNPIFMPHSLKGLDFIKDHPEARAEDLMQAFSDDSINMILCAIGGDDTYRLLPYLFENDQLQKVIKPKIFLGFSDTTMNHLMLHKLGVKTFYGQSFLADICELDKEMPSLREKFSEVALNLSMISLTTLDTQTARSSAKNTNFFLTYLTGKEKSSCWKQVKKSLNLIISKKCCRL